MRGAPINLMIDKPCGKNKADLKLSCLLEAFIAVVGEN